MSQLTHWYLFVVLPAAWLGSYVLEAMLWPLFGSGYASNLEVWASNTVPSALAGIATIGSAAVLVHYRRVTGVDAAWWRRCSVFLIPAAGLGLFILAGSRSPDFGLVSQLYSWPLVALLAGSAVEPLAASIGRRLRPAAV